MPPRVQTIDVPSLNGPAVGPPEAIPTTNLTPSPWLVRETVFPHAHGGERALWHGRKERISYASCNETSACEVRALRPGPGKRLFCVTAGGGRVLDLLADGPDEVWAVDLNPSQNHLLELKIAGITELSHREYLEFLGVRPSRERLAVYARLRPRLSEEAQRFFAARPRMLKAGVLYQGCLERFLAHVIVPAVRIVRPFWVRRLMAATTIEQQRKLFQERGTRLWRAVVGTFCRRRFFEWFSGEAGFWRYLPADFPLHTRVVSNVFGYLETHLARDNHLASLIFNGRYTNEAALPPYLQPEPFERIRAALGRTRMRLITGTVGDALHRAPTESFDGFALSDISSYLDDVSYRGVFDQVMRTARKGARVCSRGILRHRDPPAEFAARLRREPELEREFARDDASMVHEFVVGELP
jgi:S-adenosylmethionine-diacylglycerol 3-amino-3-carboxypropyl transferase